MFIIVLIGYGILGIYEFVPLYMEKRWKEFYVNLALSVISFTLALLISLKVKIPSPLKPVESIIYFLFGELKGN